MSEMYDFHMGKGIYCNLITGKIDVEGITHDISARIYLEYNVISITDNFNRCVHDMDLDDYRRFYGKMSDYISDVIINNRPSNAKNEVPSKDRRYP